jgi:hypothetical protein
MMERLDPATVEELVGAMRHPTLHIAIVRAASGLRVLVTQYELHILHSQLCVQFYGKELEECTHSRAGADGLSDEDQWPVDVPVPVRILKGRLVPLMEKLHEVVPFTKT